MQGETIGRETIGRGTMEENLLGDLKDSKPFSLETTSGKHPLFRSPPLWNLISPISSVGMDAD